MTEEWRNLRPEEYIRSGDEWFDERDESWNSIGGDGLGSLTAKGFGGVVRRRLNNVAIEATQLLADVRDLETRMTNSERLHFWGKIVIGYCPACGNKHPCECFKDEGDYPLTTRNNL